MNLKFWQNLFFLRLLAGFWGWLTIIIFSADFFTGHTYNSSVSGAAVIYGTILTMYVGSKEYQRWHQKQQFPSKYFGEFYVVIWTLVMVFFVVLSPLSQGHFKIPGEFTAVYLTVISIFILSQQSKSLKRNK